MNLLNGNGASRRLRNTYQVPAGKIVVVDTPEGEHKYTGGQFVKPEQLANAHERVAEGGSGGGSQEGDVGAEGPDWYEIVKEFKLVDPSDKSVLNTASYKIRQFINIPLNTSKNVAPACKFAVELAIANYLNSQPGIGKTCEQLGIQIKIEHPKDASRPVQNLASKKFVKLGEVNFKENKVVYFQYGEKVKDLVQKTAHFVCKGISLLIIKNLLTQSKVSGDEVAALDNQIQTAQTTLKKMINEFASKHKGKPPKPGDDQNIDESQENLQQLLIQKQQLDMLKEIVGKLQADIKKEGGINPYIDSLIIEDDTEGVAQQVAELLAQANIVGLGINGNFEKGMEVNAERYPDTTDKIRNLMMYLTAITQEEQSPEGTGE